MQRQQMEMNSEAIIEELFPRSSPRDEPYQYQQTFYAKGKNALTIVKELIQMADVIKITIWHKRRRLATIPIVYGGLAAALFPFISIFSVISLLALNCKIVVEKKN